MKNEALTKLGIEKLYASGMGFLSVTDDLKIYTWGWNEHGNLGTGDKIDRFEP